MKYGDVITFKYADAEVTAMVILDADSISNPSFSKITGEGTMMDTTPGRLMVFGLAYDSTDYNGGFHRPGVTATTNKYENPEVIE